MRKSSLPWVALAIALLGLAYAASNRFVQDDAYISFRYARNLVDGLGLVFNAGERVEGYTNFLWTLLMVPAFWLGVDVAVWSWTVSLACFAGTLWVLWRWVSTRFSQMAALIALGLMVVNYSISCYATGGLETQCCAFWVVLSAWLLHGRRCAWAGLASAAAFLTRMDSCLLLIPFWLWAAERDWRRWRAGIAVGAPIVLGWMLWRHAYYGAWLPNTFLIKGGLMPVRGAFYVGSFFILYGWWLALPLLRPRLWNAIPWCLPGAVVLWLGYVVLVGGCFMEFRLLVGAYPFLAVMAGVTLWEFRREGHRIGTWVVVGGMLALGLMGLPRFMPSRGMQPIWNLKQSTTEFHALAADFGRSFGTDAGKVKIAVTAAGILPYDTGMPAFDLLGLNDREVALNGARIAPAHRWLGNWPGHVRMATWNQVVKSGTDLVVNHPWIVGREEAREIMRERDLAKLSRRWPSRFHVEVPEGAKGRPLLWPLADGRYLVTLSITENPVVLGAYAKSAEKDAAISAGMNVLPVDSD